MPNTSQLDQLDTESIQLPQAVADKLRAEAKKSHMSVPEFLMQWLEDQADAREAAAVMQRIEAGKEKALPWDQVRNRLLTLP